MPVTTVIVPTMTGKGNGNKGPELQIWTVSDGNGFHVLRFTDGFKQFNRDLFEE
jgi:hypothetical protein